MALTAEQKQAFREKAASAKVQSKLPAEVRIPDHSPDQWADERVGEFDNVSRKTIGTGEEAYQEAESQAAPPFPEQLAHVNLDDIPWEEAIPTTSLQTVATQQLVEGFVLKPGMSMDDVEELSEQIYSYLGATPVHVGRYIGRWIKVLGCVAVPLEGDVVDKETGDIVFTKWVDPRFKLSAIDDSTGENVIMHGGGKNGLQFVRHMTSLYGPGDWSRPKEMLIVMESRANAHVLYHFRHRRIQQQ